MSFLCARRYVVISFRQMILALYKSTDAAGVQNCKVIKQLVVFNKQILSKSVHLQEKLLGSIYIVLGHVHR